MALEKKKGYLNNTRHRIKLSKACKNDYDTHIITTNVNLVTNELHRNESLTPC